jgi:Zn-finger nucleic acid-binding protein
MVNCPKCGCDAIKFGFKKDIQRFQCKKCKYVFLQKNASSLSASTSLRGEASEPQPQEQEYDQPQDYAEEIVREHEKPKEPIEPRNLNRTTNEVISDGASKLIAEGFLGLLGLTEKKKKTETEGIDYI